MLEDDGKGFCSWVVHVKSIDVGGRSINCLVDSALDVVIATEGCFHGGVLFFTCGRFGDNGEDWFLRLVFWVVGVCYLGRDVGSL